MKNKGRKHKAAKNEEMSGILNCKGLLTHITRPINQMGKSPAWEQGVSKKISQKEIKIKKICHDTSCPPYDSFCFHCGSSSECRNDEGMEALILCSNCQTFH